MEIAVLIPCLNEARTIKKVIDDFRKSLPSAAIYVYDNNSTDDTFQIATDAGAVVVKEYNRGKANVVQRMFTDIEADIYLMVDGDATYPADTASHMIELLISRNLDIVVGDRLSNASYAKENKRKFHGAGNELIKKLINFLFNASLKDILSGYRVFSRKFVKNYPSLVEGFELETEITIFSLHHGFRIHEIPINYQDRPTGSESKLNTFSDGFKVLKTMFNLFRYYKPMIFFSTIAGILFLLGVAMGIRPILEYVEFKYVYRVPSAILASGLMIAALLCLFCGLILDTIVQIDKKQFKHLMNFNK
ncbi:MAG: glycosyltransferase family 2 protein [Bacteroidetes bacterium]|nr:glycosyltransferase family 2 protein [Bacteroidota bacterium]